MHKRFVLNIISRFVLVVSLVMLIPLGWSFYGTINILEVKAFCFSIIGAMVLSSLGLIFLKLNKSFDVRVSAKDGLSIVGLSWITLSFLGAMPFYLSGYIPSFTDAFFETVSGFTTTGATILTDIEALPRGLLFWRSLTHWLGGMGIIVMYIALLPTLGPNAFHLYKAEAPGLTVERITPRIKETAKILWRIYLMLSLAQMFLLWCGGMNVFESMCHTFGTMATGGFSTSNMSLAGFSAYSQWIVMFFMYLAGINFIMHFQFFVKGRFELWYKNEELLLYNIIILISGLYGTWMLFQSRFDGAPFRDAFFQTISIVTTTGFTSVNYELWPYSLQVIIVLLMFVGGCGGSTGGGLKMIRILLATKAVFRSVIQNVYPNAVMTIKYNRKPLTESVLNSVLIYMIVYVLLLGAGTVVFIFTEQCDLLTGFTAVLSALSNIGPGLGSIGPMDNFAWISVSGKWTLIFLMLAGRLELFSILILLAPATWRK